MSTLTQAQPGTTVWNLAYDAGYGAGPAVFGLTCIHTGYPAGFALTGALILAVVPVALRERKAVAGVARPVIRPETVSADDPVTGQAGR